MVQSTKTLGSNRSTGTARRVFRGSENAARLAYPLIAGAVASALALMHAAPAMGANVQDASLGNQQLIAANSYRLLHLLETGKHSKSVQAEKSSQMLAYANLDDSIYGPEQRADSVPRVDVDSEASAPVSQSTVATLAGQSKRFAAVYLDSRGNPTIGMGFNLRDEFVRSQILSAFGLNPRDARLTTQQQRAREQSYIDRLNKAAESRYRTGRDACVVLDGIMQARASDPVLAALGTDREPDFRFDGTDDPRIRQVFDNILDAYKSQVKHWLPQRITPDSKEYTALVSLAFNSRVHTRNNPHTSYNEHGTPITLGSRLRTALINKDRPEAWYEIRYNTNPDGTRDGDGIAKRRFVESDTFGLYEDGSNGDGLTEATARSVLRTYTRHRSNITSYERRYAAAFRNAEQAAPGVVRSLKSWMAPAKNLLIDRYVRSRGINVAITGDVFVGDDGASASSQQLGTDRNDLIVAGSGNAALRGGAGDDVLVSDVGRHTLMGDAGFDRYVVASQANTIIDDSDGQGAVYLDGKKIAGGVTMMAGVYSDHAGVRYQRSGADLIVNGTLTIRNFHDNMLGIRMVTDATVAAAQPAETPVKPAQVDTPAAVAKPVPQAKPVAKAKPAAQLKSVAKAKPAAPVKPAVEEPVRALAQVQVQPIAPAAVVMPVAPPVQAVTQPQPTPVVLAAAQPEPKPNYFRRIGRPGSF